MTLGLVKPGAIQHAGVMRARIKACGLRICDEANYYWTNIARTEETVAKLYYRAPGPVVSEIARSFFGHATPVFLIAGENAIETFRKLTGTERNPGECAQHTLRYLYGEHETVDLGEGHRFWRNAIHRPSTHEEAEWSIPVFFPHALDSALWA
jgi:nucleoside diphosphate kinase